MSKKYIAFVLMSISCLIQADNPNLIPPHASIRFFDSVPFFNRIPVLPNIEKVLEPCARVATEFVGENKNIIVGGLVVTALGLVALRKMTRNQDIPVDAATRKLLLKYRVYHQCKNIIGLNDIQEIKANKVKTSLFYDQYVPEKYVYSKVISDFRTVKNLDSWDLWFRTQCNPRLIATKKLVQERATEIQQTLTFLKTQEIYLQGQDLYEESHSLLTKFAPNYTGETYIKQRDVIKASKKNPCFQTPLNNHIEDANAFGGSDRKPAYACHEALWQKQIAIDAIKKQLPVSQYPQAVDDLSEIQNYLILWRGAVEELPEYKQQRPLTSEEAKIEREANYEKMALKIAAETNAKLTKIAELKAETERKAQEQAVRQHEITLRQARDNCSEHEAAQRVDRERLIWAAVSHTSALVSNVRTSALNN
ncbi:MAG: hypothetical protein Q8Q60_05115 [Candidatus Chromulinivorax sp.]|nr:hypothetical protein [Candidatus Chromulinivorax sp.]